MPRNASGVYSPPAGTTAVSGAVIAASEFNNFVNDIGSEMTGSLPRSGTAGMNANLAMGGNKVTGLANGTAATDAATKGQLDGVVIGPAQLADDSVTYAKIQNISATSRILGRKTAGAGDTEELTLSDVLDFIGSAAQGDILYRAAGAWARLPVGTAGQVLTSNGAGQNLSWASAGQILLATGSAAATATMDIVLSTFTAYRGLVIKLYGCLPSTDGSDLRIQFSTDAGSSYIASGYNSSRTENVEGTPNDTGLGSTSIITVGLAIGSAANEGFNGSFEILNQASSAFWPRINWQGYFINSTATPAGVHTIGGGANETAQDMNGIRFAFSAGNITASYAVYGLV